MREHTVLPVVLWTLLIPVSSAATQAPGLQESATVEGEEDPRTLDRRRLLTTEGGTILRARSRFADGTWQVRQRGKWVDLGEAVVEADLEREVLAKAKKMASDVGQDDHAQRVALADWMVHQGLYPEALKELNRVLRVEPEYEMALGLIARRPLPLELDIDQRGGAEEVRALMAAGATRNLAEREVAIARLADFGDRLDLRELVTANLSQGDHRYRAFAARVNRRLFPGEMWKPLADRMLLDGSRVVREEASVSLAATGEVAVIGPALNALDSKHIAVRTNAAEALGNLGFPAAVEPLMLHLAALQSGGGPRMGTRSNLFVGSQVAYIADYDVEIAQGASIADPILGIQDTGVAFDVRSTVQRTIVVEYQTTVRSLAKLTGEHPGDGSPAAWTKWWEKNQGDWKTQDHLARQD